MMFRLINPHHYLSFGILVLSLAAFTSPAEAQSPLEKLENKLRNKPAPDAEVVPPPPAEELPGPDPKIGPLPDKVPARETMPKLQDGPNLTDPDSPIPEPVYLGLEVQSLEPDEIGVLVTEVVDKSPAWKAGLMVGDRLLGYNGEAIDGIEYFSRRLGTTKPGDTIRFIVDRNGRNMAVPIVAQRFELAERLGNVPRPLPESLPLTGPLTTPDDSRSWLGCSVADLSETWRRQFSIPAYRGAAVSDVVANSPAASAGIKPGDVIIEIGGRAVESARDLTQWLSEVKPGTPAKVSYFRGLTAKVGELTVGSIAGPVDGQGQIGPIPDLGRPNLEGLPVADQVEYLRAEILDMQQRLLELQRELDRLQRSVGTPK
jgi:membrane-associated protease RseP (regulator of RpoE activity)